MVSHGCKVQQRRRDKLMSEEDFVCFIMAQVVMAASFQKGQFIIEVDERRHDRSKTWCVRGQCDKRENEQWGHGTKKDGYN